MKRGWLGLNWLLLKRQNDPMQHVERERERKREQKQKIEYKHDSTALGNLYVCGFPAQAAQAPQIRHASGRVDSAFDRQLLQMLVNRFMSPPASVNQREPAAWPYSAKTPGRWSSAGSTHDPMACLSNRLDRSLDPATQSQPLRIRPMYVHTARAQAPGLQAQVLHPASSQLPGSPGLQETQIDMLS